MGPRDGERVRVVPVAGDKQLEQFISLPWQIYREDPLWVPPLRREMKGMLTGTGNALFRSGPHALFLALQGDTPVGRICAGINLALNRSKGQNDGYFCLFETVQDCDVARTLFDRAVAYVASLGANAIRGPVSPTNGDEYRGLLVEGTTHRPMLFQSYNPGYYSAFLERYGFAKEIDYLAFRYSAEDFSDKSRIIDYAMKRYGFRTDPVDLRHLDRELQEIKQVIAESMPEEWPDLIPPGTDELREMAGQLRGMAVPELIRIARCGTRPIGFSVALPDYNQLLVKMNGRLFPTGWLTFLLRKREIDAIRMFIVFVVPDFHGKGVLHALYHSTVREAVRLGYRWGEGSTVHETNRAMIRENLSAGGLHYKTYRIYRRPIPQMPIEMEAEGGDAPFPGGLRPATPGSG